MTNRKQKINDTRKMITLKSLWAAGVECQTVEVYGREMQVRTSSVEQMTLAEEVAKDLEREHGIVLFVAL